MTISALCALTLVESAVIDTIRQVLPAAERQRPLRATDCLRDLGISSLRLLSLFMDLEETFELSPVALAGLTAGSSIAAIASTCGAGESRAPVVFAS